MIANYEHLVLFVYVLIMVCDSDRSAMCRTFEFFSLFLLLLPFVVNKDVHNDRSAVIRGHY